MCHLANGYLSGLSGPVNRKKVQVRREKEFKSVFEREETNERTRGR